MQYTQEQVKGFKAFFEEKLTDEEWRSSGLSDMALRLAVSGPILRALFRLYVLITTKS